MEPTVWVREKQSLILVWAGALQVPWPQVGTATEGVGWGVEEAFSPGILSVGCLRAFQGAMPRRSLNVQI